jgi:transposase
MSQHGTSRTFPPRTRPQREKTVPTGDGTLARRGAKCAQFCVGINARAFMARTTYALAYEAKHPSEAQSQKSARIYIVRAIWWRGSSIGTKHCRRIPARDDKLAGNYLALVQLASIRRWLF